MVPELERIVGHALQKAWYETMALQKAWYETVALQKA